MSFKKTYNFRLGYVAANLDDELKRIYDAINSVKASIPLIPDTPREYKEYVALITQSGTTAPTVTKVLKNDIGSDIVWGYLDVGHYTASSIAGKFFVDKTVVFIQLGQTPGFVTAYAVDTDTVDIFTYDTGGSTANAIFDAYTSIVIRCYL